MNSCRPIEQATMTRASCQGQGGDSGMRTYKYDVADLPEAVSDGKVGLTN